jgi:hypothetical protein
MEVLVRFMCDCASSPRLACPQCRDKKSISRWLPLDFLPLLTRSYIILDRRFVPARAHDYHRVATVCLRQ